MELILTFIAAFAITAFSIPLTIKLAQRYGLVDDPKLRPHPAHVHQGIVPRAGGLSIYLGIFLTSVFFLPMEKHLLGILLGITLLLNVGLLDDKIKNFNPYLRLFLLLIASGMAVASGIGISYITNPLADFALPLLGSAPQINLDKFVIPIYFFGVHNIVLIADLFALFWIMTLMQVINWSKGVDGQMPAITLVASITLGLLSYKLFLEGDINQLSLAKLSFVVAGTSLGFLVFNWHPAKIFPGFSGSTILAFMLATLSILSGAKVATALLVLGVPAADFIYTFFRRIAQGHSPVWGDRGHLHHRLLDIGWSHRQISLFYMLVSAVLGSIALFASTESKFFAGLIVLILFIGFILLLNSLSAKKSDD